MSFDYDPSLVHVNSAVHQESLPLKERLFCELPEDGSALSNAEIRRRLGVDQEEYWRARDLLVEEGRAVRGRGQGGSTSRVVEDFLSVPTSPELEASVEDNKGALRQAEAELYDPLVKVLGGDWQADRGFEYLAVENISRAGGRSTGGKWTRPDLVGVDLQVLTYLPVKTLSVHTFEVKPSDMIDVTAVYEALAHRRAATHSYVLLHVPENPAPVALETVIAEARRHGIGVIVFADPNNYDTWDERVVADRVDPEPTSLNEFISIQLSESARSKIEKAVR